MNINFSGALIRSAYTWVIVPALSMEDGASGRSGVPALELVEAA